MHSNTGWTKTKKSSYEPMEFVSAEFVKRLLTTKLSLGGGGGRGGVEVVLVDLLCFHRDFAWW